ncbi:glycosyltransferase [Mesonia sp. HuA40]|uniref:glycosyltransferase n=1 Tax=Mesonia sp. HuA40 TaxID=2602761 RepID=UPI0011CAAA01|nr:glycosyltransferase [Mesonia sp. HuA40]TXK75356.1 glycosyltransferase [Mesonia sp. HuA40]
MIAISFFILYALVIIWLSYGVNQVKYKPNKGETTSIGFSICIPMHNEAKHLPRLLKSILDLDYPQELYEIIFINDRSTDETASIITRFKQENPNYNIRLVHQKKAQQAPKKEALILAINASQFSYIATTDADVLLPKSWLKGFAHEISMHKAKLVVGPVTYLPGKGFLNLFQAHDYLSLQGVSLGSFGGGSILFCSAANMAYCKDSFLALGGFENNLHISSGDDTFVLEKFKTSGLPIGYSLVYAEPVFTYPLNSWRDLFMQRVRWAAKNTYLKFGWNQLMGALVFIVNASLLILLILGGLFKISYIFLSGGLWVFKLLVDLFFLRATAKKIGVSFCSHKFIFSALFYPLFVVTSFLFALKGGFYWKGKYYKR